MLCRKDGLAWKVLVLGKEHQELQAKGIPMPRGTLQSAGEKQLRWPLPVPLLLLLSHIEDSLVSPMYKTDERLFTF